MLAGSRRPNHAVSITVAVVESQRGGNRRHGVVGPRWLKGGVALRLHMIGWSRSLALFGEEGGALLLSYL